MKAYGYDRTNQDAESPLELRKVSLQLTLDEIDRVIAFLQDAKEKLSHGKPRSGHAHAHFRDWSDNWTASETDLIILYEG